MISPSTEWIDLIPAGTFYTNDGRGPFYNADPQAVVRESRQVLAGGVPIDFDHATDRAAPQGLPAPAAGWIREFRAVAGAIQGRVEWTARGAAALKSKEYRFISPVFEFDPPVGAAAGAQTGRAIRIRRAALTNNPALSQLPALAASRREGAQTFVGALTADQREVYRRMGLREKGVTEAQFAAQVAETRAGKPMILSSQTRKENSTGMIGPQIVGEAFEEHRGEMENQSIDSRQLVHEAQKSILEFLSKPNAPDAWKTLARASAMLTGALDRIGPAYVDRVNPRANMPGVKKQSQWQ